MKTRKILATSHAFIRSPRQLVSLAPKRPRQNLISRSPLLKGLFESRHQDRNVRLIKDKHRPQPDRVGSTASNVDSKALHLFEQCRHIWSIEGDVSTLSLAPQVLDMLWLAYCQILKFSIKDLAYFAALFHQIPAFNLLDNGFGNDQACWISNPVQVSILLLGENSKELTRY